MFDSETVPVGLRHQRSAVWPQAAYPSLMVQPYGPTAILPVKVRLPLGRQKSRVCLSPLSGPERNAFPWAFVVKRTYFGLF